MSYWKDHADAMRVINSTFCGHQLSDYPSQSWMVCNPDKGSAYHFVITWLPGRALIVTGDLGETVYSGITHLTDINETVHLIRDSSFDYLSGKSSHKKEFDAEATARHVIERAYCEMRDSFDPDADLIRETRIMDRIVAWHDQNFHRQLGSDHNWAMRKNACNALMSDDVDQAELCDIADDWETPIMSWPHAAHWHYEALRTWANLMTQHKVKAGLAAAREVVG